jgi:hypothetical protein
MELARNLALPSANFLHPLKLQMTQRASDGGFEINPGPATK